MKKGCLIDIIITAILAKIAYVCGVLALAVAMSTNPEARVGKVARDVILYLDRDTNAI